MNKLTYQLSNKGQIQRVSLEDNSVNIFSMQYEMETDCGRIDLLKNASKINENSYEFENEIFKATITYDERIFLEGNVTIIAKDNLVIPSILLRLKIKNIQEAFLYNTFKNASTFALIRKKNVSLLLGFCNPIFKMKAFDDFIEISFESGLKLNKGETFNFEPFFLGITKRSGVIIQEELPVTANRINNVYHTRYRNPSGHLLLDRNEIRTFRKYIDEYLYPYCDELKVIFYTYFCPFPRLIETDEDETTYYQYINNFKELGGDMIIFNPIQRFIQPVPTLNSRWIISTPSSRAEKILNYCRTIGIGYGFTWGSAVINTNSPMTSYTLIGEKNHWKKIGKNGELSRENCIAEEDFYQWFKIVQQNTIKEEHISLWDWDPGPGIASFCYSANHGHIPGKGIYKGFRNAMRMIDELKSNQKDLYFQTFHGLKEYGVWGLKGIDWHESYWEQDPYFFAASYPDFSADRYSASGMRMQCWWNHNFRFLPSSLNQFMATRMIQNYGSPQEFRYLFDFYGYKYSIMSCLACGGSLTLPMLPYSLDFCPEYVEFMNKWIRWGKENYSYNRNMISFGNQVCVGGIDGYAKWKDDHGYIFLCNPSPYEILASFEFGEEIGFTGKKAYSLKSLYPKENIFVSDVKTLKTVFSYGDKININVPAFEIVLLEVTKPSSSNLFNTSGVVTIKGNTVQVDSEDIYGSHVHLVLKDLPNKIDSLKINQQEIPFTYKDSIIETNIIYGKPLIREIELFNKQRIPFLIQKNKKYISSVYLDGEISNILKQYKQKIPNLMGTYRKKADNLSDDSLIWTSPDHLYATITFKDFPPDGDISLILNNQKISLKKQFMPSHGLSKPLLIGFYADITDYVKYDDENIFSIEVNDNEAIEFYGIQLYYPEANKTKVVQTYDKKSYLHKQKKIDYKPTRQLSIRKPMINNAWIEEGYVQEYQSFTLIADVNLSPDQLEGVYCSNPINIEDSKMTLMTDNALEYVPSKGVWMKKFYMASRQFLIVDEENIVIWAVDKKGNKSESFPVRIEWKLF